MGKVTVFEAKNSRAVSLLKSWLRAVEIGFRVGSGPVDLLVTARDGTKTEIQVDAGDSKPAPEGCIVIEASTLTGRHIKGALDAFVILQARLGYAPKMPVDRGALPTQKLSYIDAFEDVALRHTELRRAPNPSSAEITKYEPVMKKATWNFLRTNSRLCQDHMLEFDELFGTYARCFTINYLAWYLVPEEMDKECNNERKLYAYLWQRFGELRSLLNKKARSTLVTLDVAAIGRRGQTYDYCDKTTWVADEEEQEDEVDEAYVARHCELDIKNPHTRRASAIRLLDVKLAKLDHNSMIELLQSAAENDRIHPDAQREAAARLQKHAATCPDCIHLSQNESFGIEEDEEFGAVDAVCAQE